MASLSIADCRRAVGVFYGIPKEIMTGPSRKRKYARPRMIAMTLAREFSGASYPSIGAHFGDRDHTTCLSAMRRIGHLEATDDSIREVMWHFRITLAHRHILGRP